LIERLGSIRLGVRDLHRSLEFYKDGLHFAADSIDAQSGGSRTACLMAGNLHIVLAEMPLPEHRDKGNGRSAAVRLSLQIQGLDAYHDALVARGLMPSPPRDEANSRSFLVADPDGYVWHFVQSLD